MDRPTLRQLEILAEIARIGTFRGAARSLGLSQVAVSDHVRQLESRLGCTLFVRKAGTKPSLSASGLAVLEHGRNVLFACDALIAAAQEAAAGVTAPVKVGPIAGPSSQAVSESPMGAVEDQTRPPPSPVEPVTADVGEDSDKATPIMVASHPAILARFQDRLAAAQEAFPERIISIDFAAFTAEVVAPGIRAGSIDIALFYTLQDVPDLPSDYLWSESWSLFARADHPLASRDALFLADCQDMPVILFADGNPLRALCEASLAEAGLWPTPTILESDDYAAIAAELDYGEAVFPAFGVTAVQFAAQPGLRRLALVEALPAVQVRRATGGSALDDPVIAALAGVLG